MQLPRSSGILLHPTSLSGPYGIGGIGDDARRFIDLLAECGQRFWQLLPLVPTGYGNCPYTSYSAFAGNPLLIDPDELHRDGLLTAEELHPRELVTTAGYGHALINFDEVIAYKSRLLETAATRVPQLQPEHKDAYEHFCTAEAWWLDDYALFMALKEAHADQPWTEWETGLTHRDPTDLATARHNLRERVNFYRFCQYLFDRQWSTLKAYAGDHGIQLLGDLPIYVAADSADVWAHPELFRLDASGRPTAVAGVPPDYFSATGQLWGNPLYDWEAMARTGYRWWIDRFRRTLQTVDLVRIDHFRGFEAYWEVPAGEATAIKGKWTLGPGEKLFEALRQGLGGLPLVAEDLGIITPEVEALRDRFNLHGMRVLQFAFDSDAGNTHLPHWHSRASIVYTGTHDNDTTVGWFTAVPPWPREHAIAYLGMREGEAIHWALIRAAMASVADVAIVPLQDLLGLGREARMNTPSTVEGNWRWRCTNLDLFDAGIREQLIRLTRLYGRWQA